MPFVRYARDRRGYETLYVMHAFDGDVSAGNARNARVRVLFACRTVPYAKVGRMTIDENVQRRLEIAYPRLTFDWPKLLKEAAQSAPRPERPDPRQEQRRARGKKREPRTQGQQVPRVPQVPTVPQVRFEVPEVQDPDAVEAMEAEADVEWTPAVEPVEPGEIGSLHVSPSWPAVNVAGTERTLILRGRYIEIAHRVLSRVSEPGEQRRLFREAGRLNPEAWQTDEQARAGIAAFEEVYSRLAEQLRRQRPV